MSDPCRLGAADPGWIGVYRLTGVLGEGGQGRVYLGRAPSGREVAVKALHARVAADSRIWERFRREADLARRVAAFCTAQVLEVGIADERPYLVSEYVPGPSLHELVATGGPRSGGGLERLAIATVTALEAIHRVGIVHRDFKPVNVIMGPEGPVVIDFGIARISDAATTHSMLVGTPGYMAPEQFSGQPSTEASDVFAWAATVTYAATGRPAFDGEHSAAVIGAILTGEPDLDGVPSGLRPLLADCLSKDPATRPAAREVLAVLTGRETVSGAHGGERVASEKADRSAPKPVAVPSAGITMSDETSIIGDAKPMAPTIAETNGTSIGRPLLHERTSDGVLVDTPDADLRPESYAEAADAAASPAGSGLTTTSARRRSAVSASPPGLTVSARRRILLGALITAVVVTIGVVVVVLFSPSSVFTGHTGQVTSVAVAQLDGRPIAVSAGYDGTVRMWDLAKGRQLGRPLTGHTGQVTSVAVTQLDGRPIALVSANSRFGGWYYRAEAWDLGTRQSVSYISITGYTGIASQVAVAQLDGRPVAISSEGFHDMVRVSDLTNDQQVGQSLTGRVATATSVALTQLNGQPVVLSFGSGDKIVRVSDLITGRQAGQPLSGHTAAVTAVVVTRLNGRPVAVTGGLDRTVRVWDLATRKQLGQPFTGHTGQVTSLAVTQLNSHPVVVSASDDKTVRLWDLTSLSRSQ